MPIKVQCACGQKYSFEVEPVDGRMPAPIACPVCGVDGTAVANDIIAQNSSAPAAAAPPGMVALSGREGLATLAKHIAATKRQSGNEGEGRKWKWWYFVLAGICIGGYSIWQADTQHSVKPLGSLFLAVLCVAIGIWDFFYQRRKKKIGGDSRS
jgi:hypothetical protein